MKLLLTVAICSVAVVVVDGKIKGGRSHIDQPTHRNTLVHHEAGCELVRYTVSLTGDNEITPFVPIPGAFATTDFTVRAITSGSEGCAGAPPPARKQSGKKSRREKRSKTQSEEGEANEQEEVYANGEMFYACIDGAVFNGMAPDLLHVHEGPLNGNGPVVVDFSDVLPGSFSFSACKEIDMELANKLVDDPAWYYLNAHITVPNPDSSTNILNAIRGQLIQGFDVRLDDPSVEPFTRQEGASGMASIEFFAGGTRACSEVSLDGFSPALVHLHRGSPSENGDVQIDFGPIISGSSFAGCVSTDPALAAEILLEPLSFYFNFHSDAFGPDGPLPGFFVAVRGNLQDP